jgi:tetratricopeptide (TPR) repeat protein
LKFPGKVAAVVAVLIVLVLAAGTYQRNAVWRDGVRMWEDVVRKSPGKVRAYNNLGASLNDGGRPFEAIRVLDQAIRLKPDHPEAHYNIGRSYILVDRRTEAVLAFREAIRLKPDYDDAYVNLAGSLNRTGQFPEAAALLEERIGRLGHRADARFNLGVAYAYLGNREAARRELAAVARLDTSLAKTLATLVR